MRDKSLARRSVIAAAWLAGMGLTLGCHRAGRTPTFNGVSEKRVLQGFDLTEGAPKRLPQHSRGSWILPRFARLEPEFLQVDGESSLRILTDGTRLRLFNDGHYEVGEGVLPIGRRSMVVELPPRLGGGFLFGLASEKDTLLYRAEQYVGRLQPIGKLEQVVTAMVPASSNVLLRLQSSGQYLALDVDTAKITSELGLPEWPEYGPIAFVDSGFAVASCPLRGLFVSQDEGHSFRRFYAQNEHTRYQELFENSWSGPAQILAFDVARDKLRVSLESGEQVWLSRRGDVGVAPKIDEKAEQREVLSRLSARLEQSIFGGFPIEQAILSGLRLTPEVALYVHAGRLFWVALSTGKVLGYKNTSIARNQRCRGLLAYNERYFTCHDGLTSSIYRASMVGDVQLLAEWAGPRTVVSATEYGVIVAGVCATQQTKGSEKLGHYCAVERDGTHRDFTLKLGDEREPPIALLVGQGNVVAVSFPSRKSAGSLTWFGKTTHRVELQWPSSGRDQRVRDNAFFVRELSLQNDRILGFFVLGNKVTGYSINLSQSFGKELGHVSKPRVNDSTPETTGEGHQVTLGKWVPGSRAMLLSSAYALVPDSSGYAYESFDGGAHWQRTHLLVDVPNTDQQIERGLILRGCSSVGCVLGDKLYLYPAQSRQGRDIDDSTLSPLEIPETLQFAPKRIKLRKVRCVTTDAPARATSQAPAQRRRAVLQRDDANDPRAPKLEGTAWIPFYSQPVPRLVANQRGFDRGFRWNRYSGRLYARAYREGGNVVAWVQGTFFDAMFAERLLVAEPLLETFDGIETLARLFADRRYGEEAAPIRTVFDVEGQSGMVSFNDSGNVRSYIIERESRLMPLAALPDHEPKPLSDFASLKDAHYLLGGSPESALFEVTGAQVRVVHNFDPKKRFRASQVQLVRDRLKNSLAYLVSSETPKSNQSSYYVYPIALPSGDIEDTIIVPPPESIRACDDDEEGWLVERKLSEVAELEASTSYTDVSGSATALLQLTEQGICVRRILVTGERPAVEIRSEPRHGLGLKRKSDAESGSVYRSMPPELPVTGFYADMQGTVRELRCTFP